MSPQSLLQNRLTAEPDVHRAFFSHPLNYNSDTGANKPCNYWIDMNLFHYMKRFSKAC